jgi:hypothetical protein
MTDDQHARLDAYTTVEAVLDAHPAPLNSIRASAAAIADFRDLLEQLRAAGRAQSTYAPQSAAREDLLDALADAAVPVSQTVAAWAEDQNDPTLPDQIAFTRSDFVHARQRDALDRAALVHTTALEHLDALDGYGVDQAELDALDGAVDAYADSFGEPRHAIAERRAQTEAVERLFPQIDRLLGRRLDRFIARFDGTPFFTE